MSSPRTYIALSVPACAASNMSGMRSPLLVGGAHPPQELPRAARRVHPCHLADELWIDARDRLCPLGRTRFHGPRDLLVAVAVAADEILIDEPFRDDDVLHRVEESDVAAGLEHHVLVGK